MNELLIELAKLEKPDLVAYATAFYVLTQAVGRIGLALYKGAGLKGVARGLWLGTNTPTKAQNNQ